MSSSALLEPILEACHPADVLGTLGDLVDKMMEELSILDKKRETITKQREEDSRLVSANQMWKARSRYNYQFKNDLEIRTNHIEGLKRDAKKAIAEAEALLAAEKTKNGGVGTQSQFKQILEKVSSKTRDLQRVYQAVDFTFKATTSLIGLIISFNLL